MVQGLWVGELSIDAGEGAFRVLNMLHVSRFEPKPWKFSALCRKSQPHDAQTPIIRHKMDVFDLNL
ncbi:hypothetical protein SAMN05444851_2204 [Aliiroseovarius sediminilitoris]|uniref:Uncharacterized protein n=1 Tax=Aliiroseovarius sediminilitoris TaxID=1173584 RepID=A0A1I0Q4Z2_9RHOB|nr:hypothetical protein SAMN05444851_2204 [Aliiroseovarius sediminilitoris]